MPAGNKVLLFDLGGVLVNVAPAHDILTSLGLPSEHELYARLVLAEPWISLEVGEIDADKFSEAFVAALALDLEPARVLLEFEAWNLGWYPGATETLIELRQQHRIAILSNTNEVHWRRLSGEMAIPDLVDAAFASHLIGLRKPDARVYQHVAAELGVAPADILFFDDNPANIEAALALGIEAWQVEGVAALRKRLTDLGYL